LKILYLCNIASPYRVNFFSELNRFLEPVVLFERKSASDRNKEWLGGELTEYSTVFLKSINVGTENAFAPSILKYLKKGKYDLIIIGGYATPTSMLAIIAMKLKGIKYILNADGGFIKEDGFLKRKVKQFFIGGASAWICSGKRTKEYFIHYGAKESRVFEYPFTSLFNHDILIDVLSDSNKKDIKKRLGIKDKRVVLSVGQFIPRKGFDILLKAWQGLPEDFGLYIIGDEPTDEYLKHKEKLNLKNVNFVGFLDKETLKDYYMAADLFALPTREDIWGLVIGEAMAYGLPIITTYNCNAGLELVDETNGILISVEDIKGTGEAVETILSDEKKLKSMSKSSLNKIKPYTLENMAKRHVEIFETILKN